MGMLYGERYLGDENSPLCKCKVNSMSMKDLWTDIPNKLSFKHQELCAITLRNIWHKCNTFIFENMFASPQQVMAVTKALLETFQTAKPTWKQRPVTSKAYNNSKKNGSDWKSLM